MKFMQFLEAKFTEHSLAQSNQAFSLVRDGEQKATQTFMWFFRVISKFLALFKLPLHFLACKLGIISFPELSYNQVAAFTEEKRQQAELTRASQGPGNVIGIDKSIDIKPEILA